MIEEIVLTLIAIILSPFAFFAILFWIGSIFGVLAYISTFVFHLFTVEKEEDE